MTLIDAPDGLPPDATCGHRPTSKRKVAFQARSTCSSKMMNNLMSKSNRHERPNVRPNVNVRSDNTPFSFNPEEKEVNGSVAQHPEKMVGTWRTRLSVYLVALRPWSFTASMTPVLLGSSLAYQATGHCDVWNLLITCYTALAVHAAGNLVNTYFDYMKGVDSKKSDDRTLVDHILSPNDVATMGAICYMAGCLGFLALVFVSPAKLEHLALIYFGGLSSSFLYTGGLGLKYIALGDIAIFLTFGPVTVLFAFLSQAGTLSWSPLLYAIPLAMNTETILHSNNARDMEADRLAGIVTLPILVGETGSYLVFTLLLFGPYIMFTVMAMNVSSWFLLPMMTVFQAFKYEKRFRDGHLIGMPQQIAKLNLQLGLAYVAACIMAQREKLPGL